MCISLYQCFYVQLPMFDLIFRFELMSTLTFGIAFDFEMCIVVVIMMMQCQARTRQIRQTSQRSQTDLIETDG